jgi:hypothetical protein
MKAVMRALSLPTLLAAAACAATESVEADPDQVEAAVTKAEEQAAEMKDRNVTEPIPPEPLAVQVR